jgi:hypothetical protein
MARCEQVRLAAAVALTASFSLAPGVIHAQEVNGGAAGGSAPSIETIDQDTNTIDSTSYDRGRNVSVRERPRPDYQAEGVHVGGFMIYPKVSLSGTYDDNIYALQHGAVGDFIFSVAPEIDIQSTWSRNSLSAYVRASQDIYAKYTGEDATQYGTGFAGKFEFGQSDLTGGVDYGHFVLPRSASNNIGFSVHPIPYDYTALNAQLAHEFTRLRLSLRVDDQIYSYQNGQTPTGGVVFEEDQNRNVVIVTGKAEFAVSPDTAVYVTALGNNRDYQLGPPQLAFTRNSSGYEVDGGANFDLTHLLRGEIQVGYMQQNYVSPLFKPIGGPSAKVQVEWFPSQLTTVTVQGSRFVGDAGVIGSAGYLGSIASVQVDHELLRNLILTGVASAAYDQYNGVSRNDSIYGVGVSANWLLNRHLGLTLGYNFANQTSAGLQRGPSFDDNRVSLSAVIQY